jgi:carboxylesterase type B
MATATLDHPSIGKVVGNADREHVTRYLGLQYATLTDRFAPPQMKSYTQNDTIDATAYG